MNKKYRSLDSNKLILRAYFLTKHIFFVIFFLNQLTLHYRHVQNIFAKKRIPIEMEKKKH